MKEVALEQTKTPLSANPQDLQDLGGGTCSGIDGLLGRVGKFRWNFYFGVADPPF